MNEAARRKAAKEFARQWKDKGYEKGQSQPFWTALLRDVFGVEKPEDFIVFEEQVKLDRTSFIDGHIPATKVLIEQKSLGKKLDAPIRQSDGTKLNPFQQAKRYIAELPLSQHPRWVITCNFAEFHVYDMENPKGEPEVILLKNLGKEYYRLQFLVDTGSEHVRRETEVSIAAGEIVGLIYDALSAQYAEPGSARALKSLNVLCVRLVFCLYAEDAGVFGRRGMFHDYLTQYAAKDTRRALIDLFRVLDAPPEKRDEYLPEDLAAFPYVNGGLFADEEIEIPRFTDEIRELLLVKASENFDWSEISPTIFGAVFESTLNPETRRAGGMHYTSIENIHKVIDPLFLNELKAELAAIKSVPAVRTRERRLREFQQKLTSLVFFDPAAGSGNFLTETYLSLRRLENEVLRILLRGQISFGADFSPIQVSIAQFYGIEINDFAVTVARTALWIAESQMMKETETIVARDLDFLPLKTAANIAEGNALRMDWESVVPKAKLSYIMGNPPFCGRRYRTPSQIEEVAMFFKYKDIDYVACWYKKAAEFIAGTSVKCSLVSTNSITQGEQVAALWENLFEEYGVHIDYAYRTFRWNSESSEKAAVFCVIIGFSTAPADKPKKIYDNGMEKTVMNINGYLVDAPAVFIKIRTTPLCAVPAMRNGNVPLDGDALKIEEKDYAEFSNCRQYVKRLIGGRELLHNEKRYVLWLVGVSPHEIKAFPQIYKRVELCRNNRLRMKDAGTQKLAETPMTFRDINNPARYIALPMVSSERRRYIPMAYFDGETIPTNQVQIIPDATLYHFGVLTSNVHMAWMRAVCGRLEMRYRYSKDIVYNNFPWPSTPPPIGQYAKGGDRTDSTGYSGRTRPVSRLFACRPVRRADDASRTAQGAPGQRPRRHGRLRFQFENEGIRMRRRADEAVSETDRAVNILAFPRGNFSRTAFSA